MPAPDPTSLLRSWRAGACAVLLVLLAACSGSGGTDPGSGSSKTPVAVSVVSGSGQTAAPGSALPAPLVVTVTNNVGDPISGVTVQFQVTSGTGTLSTASAVTDASGQASTQLTLGTGSGAVQVTATVKGTALATTFSASPSTNPTNVTCAPGDLQTLTPGQAITPTGSAVCVPGGTAGAEYALIPFNAAGDARSRASFAVLPAGVTTPTTPLASRAPAGAPAEVATVDVAAVNARSSFELRLRERRKAELEPMMPAARAWYASRSAGAGATVRRSTIPANVAVGTLVKLNANSDDPCINPDYRVGRVEAVTSRAIVVSDTANPIGGFTTAEYQSFGVTFDTLVDAVDRRNFGDPTDIDNNGHVVLFFTSAVNALTPRNSSEYTAGMFDSRDLFPTQTTNALRGCGGSNVAEMFYLLVPDPNGQINGNRRSKTFVTTVTIATIAHEYQHLINASRRLYVNTSAAQLESVWLDEGLSHVAEELLFYARAHLGPRQDIDANTLRASPLVSTAFFDDGVENFDRLSEYLDNPLRSSPYADNDSLSTRGATWSFLRYAVDQTQPAAQEQTWQRLVNATSTGITNLQQVFGSSLTGLFRDWATSLILDDVAGADARYQMPSWNLRSVYGMTAVLGRYPLRTTAIANGVTTGVTLPGGSAAYLRFAVPAGGTGSLSWNAPPASVMLTLVRLR